MKKTALPLLMLVLCASATIAHADDQIATVQQQLKDQGFYYGQVDGQPGSETTAAIRRYQIRNGLQVTGNLTKETLDSLQGGGGNAQAADTTTPPVPQPLSPNTTNPTPQPTPDASESDRDYLRDQNKPQAGNPPSAPPAPQPPPVAVQPQPPQQPVPNQQPPSLPLAYAALFERTPYEHAPLQVQESTVQRVQTLLARNRFYQGGIDGVPGPGTEHAIALFQASEHLPQTGRLDMDTLAVLRMLPNERHQYVAPQPFYPPNQPPPYDDGGGRVYRGIWVH